MNVAFYAPMKPPDHVTPSGDRSVARLLLKALRGGGHRVRVASRFRSYEGIGCDARQAALERRGDAYASRLLARLHAHPTDRPDAWFTYHLYHKAPDWIGPRVADALGIPYLVAEASHASRQANGAWRRGYRASTAAIQNADAVIAMNPADHEGIAALGVAAERHHALPPFVDAKRLGALAAARDGQARRQHLLGLPREPVLVTVAMMRPGDKLASYRVLAAALARLQSRPWQALIVGDGTAADDVRRLFAQVDRDRVRFAGEQPPHIVPALVSGSYAMVWPACNEAWGMALLEAQALGVPCVAGASAGVASVVDDGRTGHLVPPDNVEALADAVARLLDESDARDAMSRAARERVACHHDLPVASDRLNRILIHTTASV